MTRDLEYEYRECVNIECFENSMILSNFFFHNIYML